MIFLLSQITISLLLAAIVGACIGWLWHRSRYLGQVDQYRKLAHRQQAQVKQAQSEVNMLSDDYDELNRRAQSDIDALKQETRQLPALNQNLEKSQLLVRQLMQKHETQLRELTNENETLKGKLKNINHREQALNQLQAGLEKTRRRAETMSDAPFDDSDTDLTKPLAAAAMGAVAIGTTALADDDTGDQTSLDLDGDGASDPNDELQYTDNVYDADADAEADSDTDSEDDEYDTDEDDDDDAEYEYEDDDEEVEASDDDAKYEYVYEDDDEEDDDAANEDEDDGDAEASDDDSEYEYVYEDEDEDEDAEYEEDEDEVEYLEDASDRMLRSEKTGKANASSEKKATSKAKTHKAKPGNKKHSGTEAAIAKRSAVADPEPLEQLFDAVEQHDDLQQIFGIGPVTEKALNKLGITSYSQLADLQSHDIEKIADALQIFPGRIERDNWVGSATRQLEEVLEEL